MEILIFNPNNPNPHRWVIDGSVQSAVDVVGGNHIRALPINGNLLLVYDQHADEPNRIIDGAVMHGTFFVCDRAGRDLPRNVISRYCRWRLAQYAVAEGE